MKKLCRMHVIIVLAASVSMSLLPMELLTSLLPDLPNKSYKPGLDNRDVVLFAADFSFVPVEKSHLPLIKALCPEYIKHKTLADSGRVIPSFSHVSTSGLSLVNEALKVRPDKFLEYFEKLKEEDKKDIKERFKEKKESRIALLIKASGRYDENGKKTMLDVPEITNRLIDVYFDENLSKHIKSYLKNIPEETKRVIDVYFSKNWANYIKCCLKYDDADEVRAYFKEQLIAKKGIFSIRQSLGDKYLYERMRDDIYLGSFFINAGNTINQFDYPIDLKTQNEVRKTYAVHFGAHNYEYRITDVGGNNCFLWVVNHDNPSATFYTHIQLKHPIKGCKISNTQKEIEYALIYSKNDMILAEIHTKGGLEFVNPIKVNIPERSVIVDVCFEPILSSWIVGLYEERDNVFKSLSSGGILSDIKAIIPCKKHGFMKKMTLYQGCDAHYICVTFGVAGQKKIVKFKSDDAGRYNYNTDTPLQSIADYASYKYGGEMAKINGATHVFEYNTPFFIKNAQAQESNQAVQDSSKNQSFFDAVSELFSSVLAQPESEVHRLYSPNGEFLMCNSLKNKAGSLYVETVIKDAASHKQIISFDTLYFNFVGVGFTHDSKDLIVVNRPGRHEKISLITDEDKQMLDELEKVAFSNCGVTSLLKRLCLECRENKIVALKKDSSTRAMLMEWAKSSKVMKNLLMKCLPIEIK